MHEVRLLSLSVCLSGCHIAVPCKEQIEVLFGKETLGGSRHIVLDGVLIPPQ